MLFDKQTTQFWYAILVAAGLVAATIISFFLPNDHLAYMLAGGLIGGAGAAGSWLFRLNGYASGQQQDKADARVLAALGAAQKFVPPPWSANPSNN